LETFPDRQSEGTPRTGQAMDQVQQRAGTSDSGDLRNRLRKRVQDVLLAANDPEALRLGSPGGYHWVFLIQVAKYPDSNVRFTDMRRGVQAFLDDLVSERAKWSSGQVQDTVSLIPYHFNLLREPKDRVKQLSEFLNSPSALKQLVPGEPQNDRYKGTVWQDGHDWRAALQQTLKWMPAVDFSTQNTIIVVLDWNNLAQAPQTHAEGLRAIAKDDELVIPANMARYASYLKVLQESGLDVEDVKKGLETVQVGNLEYDMAVFTAAKLTPLPTSTLSSTATPPPIGGSNGDGGAGGVFGLIILGALGAGLAYIFLRPHRIRINDDKVETLKLYGRSSLDLVGENVVSKAPAQYQLSRREAPHAPEQALATIYLVFPGQIRVKDGAYLAKTSSGLKEVPGGLLMTGRTAEFELRSGDRLVTLIGLKRI
jgi:hypothetical protein